MIFLIILAKTSVYNKSDVKEEKTNGSLCNAQYPRGYLINIDKEWQATQK